MFWADKGEWYSTASVSAKGLDRDVWEGLWRPHVSQGQWWVPGYSRGSSLGDVSLQEWKRGKEELSPLSCSINTWQVGDTWDTRQNQMTKYQIAVSAHKRFSMVDTHQQQLAKCPKSAWCSEDQVAWVHTGGLTWSRNSSARPDACFRSTGKVYITISAKQWRNREDPRKRWFRQLPGTSPQAHLSGPGSLKQQLLTAILGCRPGSSAQWNPSRSQISWERSSPTLGVKHCKQWWVHRLPWWSGGQDSQCRGPGVWSLVKELDPTCHN